MSLLRRFVRKQTEGFCNVEDDKRHFQANTNPQHSQDDARDPADAIQHAPTRLRPLAARGEIVTSPPLRLLGNCSLWRVVKSYLNDLRGAGQNPEHQSKTPGNSNYPRSQVFIEFPVKHVPDGRRATKSTPHGTREYIQWWRLDCSDLQIASAMRTKEIAGQTCGVDGLRAMRTNRHKSIL